MTRMLLLHRFGECGSTSVSVLSAKSVVPIPAFRLKAKDPLSCLVLLSAEDRQFRHFQETLHALEADLAQPVALHFQRGMVRGLRLYPLVVLARDLGARLLLSQLRR